jgi:hypothetical protein
MPKLLVLTILFVWAAPAIYAQQAEEIRHQLEQLKQEYQAKIRDLEQRIATLENQTEQQKEARGISVSTNFGGRSRSAAKHSAD